MNRNDADVELFDATLRDGTQREGLSLSCDDKLRIARRLDALGVTFIEGGWPGSNPKDADFFRRAREIPWRTATIVAFGATRRAGCKVEDDLSVRALVEARTKACSVFGKSSILHVEEVLRTTRDENLRMIEETVAYVRAAGRRVIYDAEHFFDGWREDAAYALETLRAALRGGAETIVLCDTNGGSMPWQIADTVTTVRRTLDARVGIHAHDDAGCAVANTLAAVRAGARHVQGTINGYGERCGNANLCAIVPTLELKLGLRCLPKGGLRELRDVAHLVAEIANVAADEHAPYVGRSAFAHKGGVHVAAVRRNPATYQHIDPGLVGNEMRVVVSELSGRGNVLSKAEELGLRVAEGTEVDVLDQIKQAEARGYSYEAAEASVALMLRRRDAAYRAPFALLEYKVMVGRRERGDAETFAEATIKVEVGDHVVHTAGEGNGPVSALDSALRKALTPAYPCLARTHLADYKVRILDGTDGTRATTRVLIHHTDGERRWSTVGASPNIIEASYAALADGIEYALLQTEKADEGANRIATG